MNVSVIIPIYNEISTITKLQKSLKMLDGTCEIIFVDGGSTDGTVEMIESQYKVVHTSKGRANQQNMGARVSEGEVLFFLHCDSEVPRSAIEEISDVIRRYEVGCFGIAFHSHNIWMKCCQIISNYRIKHRNIMYGDQGIFIKRQLFFELGGFPILPIMEDYQFSLYLKERKIQIGMTRSRIYTSERRFKDGGKLRVMWNMHRLRVKYREGVDAEKISEMYPDIR